MIANRPILLTALFSAFFHIAISQPRNPFSGTSAGQQQWVDSVFNSLNKRERIAQLFFIRAHTDKGKAFEDSVASMIKRDKVGGLVFFQGGPVRQAALTNYYQTISQTPLLIAMDAEWGLGMRLDSTLSFPYQLSLGAIQDSSLIYQMGREVAKDFKLMGMHFNFAPVADINNNPANPVIGYRSFGDNKYNVASKALAYMSGMQDGGILTSLKHFPGHGDTNVDSHYDLPILKFSRERLDSLELVPFRKLIAAGAAGVMIAHMNIPSLDTTAHLPSTLSAPIITGILKQELGFKGLIVSDAMEMKGVTKYFPDGEADVKAIIAGNDIIELSENTHRAIKLTKKAVRKGLISKERIHESVKKVLEAKYWVGLNHLSPADTTGLIAKLNRSESASLNQRLADASVTVLKSDSMLKSMNTLSRTAIISLGVTEVTPFQTELKRYFPNSMNFILSKIASSRDISAMLKELRKYDQIVLAIHDYRKRPQSKLDYNSELKLFIAELAKLNTVSCVFANPYTIAGLPGFESSKTILLNYQNGPEQQRAATKVIAGMMQANGRLPVTINSFFKNGDGIDYFPAPKAVTGQTN
ncbi:glycoside hydrolase family 3 protein [Pararcticibacter amylolyticus]|uniref:beta-N-acetylhexosaminidase n=1 Tax=Pararcticibacter amylolyticus TaxID=2173175 RepID=A0A2U2PAR6_9SPHI|nr:glycoside hydrolase family 3 N-terminal domain-containing protein [Pararcticibacter amylolyticus]PWG78219.1 glycoside hydrolase family 3 [Pararcticibacter amylolyticus]